MEGNVTMAAFGSIICGIYPYTVWRRWLY